MCHTIQITDLCKNGCIFIYIASSKVPSTVGGVGVLDCQVWLNKHEPIEQACLPPPSYPSWWRYFCVVSLCEGGQRNDFDLCRRWRWKDRNWGVINELREVKGHQSSVSVDFWFPVKNIFSFWYYFSGAASTCYFFFFFFVAFFSRGNWSAPARSFPDCLLDINFHQLEMPWAMWSAKWSLFRCSSTELENSSLWLKFFRFTWIS